MICVNVSEVAVAKLAAELRVLYETVDKDYSVPAHMSRSVLRRVGSQVVSGLDSGETLLLLVIPASKAWPRCFWIL